MTDNDDEGWQTIMMTDDRFKAIFELFHKLIIF